jgi:hypothetical protein
VAAGSAPSGSAEGDADAFAVEGVPEAPLATLEVSMPSTLISLVFFDSSDAALAKATSPSVSGTSNVLPAQKSVSAAVWTGGRAGRAVRPNVKVNAAA